jgi:hypothetical protein
LNIFKPLDLSIITMKLKSNNLVKYLLIGVLFLLALMVILNLKDFNAIYIKVFKQSKIVCNYNKYGQLDGEFTSYINGNLHAKCYFKNGLREGLCVWYDVKSGKKKDEIYYQKGKPYGIENAYYPNGSLNYTVPWKDGRHLNSQYHYLNNGKINTYDAFDLRKNEDNMYCYVAYDNAGKFHQILGNVFSSYIYSTCRDSIIELVKDQGYNCVNDLYLNVATPPLLNASVEIVINKIRFNKKTIQKNVVVVPNAFGKPGRYDLVIYGHMLTKYGATVKSDTLTTRLFKK